MKQIFLLLILLILIGCDFSNDIFPPVRNPIQGNYIGKMTATYPGADDSPITKEDSIRIEFTDYQFFYYWINDIDTSIDGRGTYSVESNVSFNNTIEPTTNPPITIDGVFSIRWGMTDVAPDTLFLQQFLFQDSSSIIEMRYNITLVRDEILE